MEKVRALLCLLVLGACGGCAFAPVADYRVAAPEQVDGSTGDRIARVALDLVGTPYRYGGNTPDGLDCSGLVQYVHKQVGIVVPRTSKAQYQAGQQSPHLQAGDVLFFRISDKVGHSGVYIGNGRFVHAPSSGKQVSVARTDSPYFGPRLVGARRYF